MKRRYALRILGLLVGLVHIVNLVACSPSPTLTPTRAVTPTSTQEPPAIVTATPSPVASTPASLSQVLERWDAQRVPFEDLKEVAQEYLEDGERTSSFISYAIAGQMFMVGGDMRAAIEALNNAVAIAPQADIPHYLLADVIYRLTLFDMIDRGLCSIKLTPVREISQASLHHGYLQTEIIELVNAGRPNVYREILASREIDEKIKLQIHFYLLWLVRDTLAGEPDEIERVLEDLGGPPKMLPVPECEPDARARSLLRMAYDEILLAEQGNLVETPGAIIVDRDKMANVSIRIQVLLGDESVPIIQPPSSVPTSTPETPTEDPWQDIIDRMGTQAVDIPLPYDYEDLQREQQDACISGSLMQCYMVGYQFLQIAKMGNSSAYADAINTFNLILESNPHFGRAHYGLGRVYYDLALTDLLLRDQIRTTDSGLPIPVVDKQGAELLQRALDEFEMAFTLDLELANDSDARQFIEMTKAKLVNYWIGQGYEMETSGNPATAVEHYEKALRLDPQSYVANFNKGNALLALSEFQEAIQAYDKALIVRPNAVEAIYGREFARLRAAGVPWTDRSQVIEFLKEDLESSDRKTQLGAILVLMLKCDEGNQEACSIVEVAMQQDSTLLDDLENLEMPNR